MHKISLTEITDSRGSLIALNKLPFPIKRVFTLKNIKTTRGGHAHKNLWEILIAVSGSCRIVGDDTKTTTYEYLTNPSEAVVIPPKLWRTIDNCTTDCIIVSLCSEELDESDYIRKYEDFVEEMLV